MTRNEIVALNQSLWYEDRHGEGLTAEQKTLFEVTKAYLELLETVRGHEAFQRSVSEALNSGDGAYRP